MLPLCLLLLLFLVWPMVLILWESFLVEGKLSLSNYLSMFTTKLYGDSLKTSLVLSLTTTIIGTVLGIPLSYALYRSGGRIKALMLSITPIPLTFSGLVVGFAFIILLGASGFITLLLSKIFNLNPLEFSSFLFTWKGLVVAYLYFLIPRMVLTMISAWSKADWSLVDAAYSLGASKWMTLRKVLLPMIWPAVLAGSSLLFAVSMGAFGTAFALSGTGVKILPLVIYTHVSEISVDIGKANALAIILALVTTVMIMVYERVFATKE
nr:ABC transporter permease subunit [Acetomicrobium mobile]